MYYSVIDNIGEKSRTSIRQLLARQHVDRYKACPSLESGLYLEKHPTSMNASLPFVQKLLAREGARKSHLEGLAREDPNKFIRNVCEPTL